jgi:hypothetical protein
MTLKERIDAFSELGTILRDALDGKPGNNNEDLAGIINRQQYRNPWFTPENVTMALKAIARELTQENLRKWTAPYNIPDHITDPLKAGVVMAGNIPLAGFHDFITVLITGNKIIAKPSSKDEELIVLIARLLSVINPGFSTMIDFMSDQLSEFDVVIATGSNNSSRYFEYYFGKYPHIIRKNRNSIAIIEGTETDNEIKLLASDIFSYFGLGCRNVSKIYIPRGYDLDGLTDKWYSYSYLIDNTRYANNYDFHKAVFLVNREPFTDTGYLLLKENSDLVSPVSVLNYEYYNSLEEVNSGILLLKDRIQCITGRNHTPFGMSQSPKLWEYADDIDTLEFLLKKNHSVIL